MREVDRDRAPSWSINTDLGQHIERLEGQREDLELRGEGLISPSPHQSIQGFHPTSQFLYVRERTQQRIHKSIPNSNIQAVEWRGDSRGKEREELVEGLLLLLLTNWFRVQKSSQSDGCWISGQRDCKRLPDDLPLLLVTNQFGKSGLDWSQGPPPSQLDDWLIEAGRIVRLSGCENSKYPNE